jgi:NodT family efflux transporter outer membrane factor (OMF) lipoprotein
MASFKPLTSGVFAAVIGLMTGCGLHTPPDSAQLRQDALPNLHLPQQWKAPAHAGEVLSAGFGSFNQPALEALLHEALSYNADLRAAAARVEQAAGYVTIAGADLWPSLTGAAKGGGKWGGGDGLNTAVFAAAWELDVWGRQRYGARAATDTYASAQLDYAYAQQSLAAMVIRSWLLTIASAQQEAVLTAMVQAAEQIVSLSQKRKDIGTGSEQDVVKAQATLGEYRDALREVQFARTQALRALEILLGRYPAAEILTASHFPAMPAPAPAGLPSELLERRPDVVAAERRVAAAFNQTEEARAARLPTLSLTATFGAVSSDLIMLKSNSNPIGGLGGSLLWPLFNAGALEAQVEIRNAQQKEAVANYAVVGLRAFNEVEQALAGETALRERQVILQQVVSDRQRSADLSAVQYQVGRVDKRSVLKEQLSVGSARLSLLQVQNEYLAQRVNLHLALGGSFVTLPASSEAVVTVQPESPASP